MISDIGSLRGVKKAICGIKSNDLITETIKHVDVHISYNQKLQIDKNFVENICNMKIF